MKNMNRTNYSAYVSQKDWKDADKMVECTVKCMIDNVLHKTFFLAQDPLSAISTAQKSQFSGIWHIVK